MFASAPSRSTKAVVISHKPQARRRRRRQSADGRHPHGGADRRAAGGRQKFKANGLRPSLERVHNMGVMARNLQTVASVLHDVLTRRVNLWPRSGCGRGSCPGSGRPSARPTSTNRATVRSNLKQNHRGASLFFDFGQTVGALSDINYWTGHWLPGKRERTGLY